MASADPFITVDDLSDWIGRDVTADNGAVIAIDAACDIVRTFTDQTFNAVAGDVVTLDGAGTDCLLLPELPVIAAGTVVENGGTLTLDVDYVLARDGKLIRTGGNGTYSTVAGGITAWSAGRQNVTVTYDHGYTVDVVAGTSDVPRDIRFVALALAQRMIVQGPVSSEGIGGQTVAYAVAPSTLTAGEQAVLQKYRPRG